MARLSSPFSSSSASSESLSNSMRDFAVHGRVVVYHISDQFTTTTITTMISIVAAAAALVKPISSSNAAQSSSGNSLVLSH